MSGKKNIYSLNDTDGRSLVSQLCERIKVAVRSGALKKGEQLPSIRQLAELAGVSVKVPREAIARLSAEGLLMPRRILRLKVYRVYQKIFLYSGLSCPLCGKIAAVQTEKGGC